MISSDDMDSNDLWAQRNDSTSSLFWKSDYKTTAKKLFVISFTFLSNLQVPQFQSLDSAVVNQAFWTRTSGPSKAPEVRSYDRQLITLLMIKYSLKIWRLFHCEKVINAEFHFHRAKIFISLELKCSNYIPSYHRHYQIDSPIYDIWEDFAISLRIGPIVRSNSNGFPGRLRTRTR